MFHGAGSRADKHCACSPASEVTIGVSQSVLKDAFFKIFLAGPRSRSPRKM